jgi:putative endonuclease
LDKITEFTVYVIRSQAGIRYIGYTEDLQKRLAQHNSGISKYTSRDTGWVLIYSETYSIRAEAMKREKWLKSGVGRRFLDSIEAELSSGS